MAHEFDLRSLEQVIALLDQGAFLGEVTDGMRDLHAALLDNQVAFGGKPSGSMTLKLGYQLMKSGDVQLTGTVDFAHPKSPKASGVAYIGDDAQLTLGSPMMKRMQGGVRDASTDHHQSVRDTAAE